MADANTTGTYVPVGVNHGNQYFCKAVAPTAVGAGDKLNLTAPAAFDVLPISCQAFTASGAVYTGVAPTITSHNTSTGLTVVTLSAGLAAGGFVVITYLGI
jgi:hypothetical protein